MSEQEKVKSATIALNKIIEATIRNAENILVDLSMNGEPIIDVPMKVTGNCEEQKPTMHYKNMQRRHLDHEHPELCRFPNFLETDTSLPNVKIKTISTTCGFLPIASARSSYIDYPIGKKKNGSLPSSSIGSTKAKIEPNSLRITELHSVTGISLDLNVLVNLDGTGLKTIPMSIECPNFQPKRICFNGEWRDVVVPISCCT